MSQKQEGKSDQSATARAEELLDQFGRRIGLFAALAAQRVRSAAASIREEADRMDQPETAPGEKSSPPTVAQAEESGRLTTERAEELVDRLGQRLSHFTSLASLQIQRAAARAREEAEDMWAEAQNIRQQNSRKLQ